jgi:polyphosphate kinase
VRTEDLENYLRDNTQAWELKSDGSYERLAPEGDEMPHSAQQFLLALLCH